LAAAESGHLRDKPGNCGVGLILTGPGPGELKVYEPVVKPPADPEQEPVSARIRARIKKARKRFFANDNISAYVREGEIDDLLSEVEGKFREVLKSLVIDTEADHNTQDTAKRVAKMYVTEVFRGRYTEAPPVTEFPNASSLNELMIVGPITVRSACSHHFCPIMGRLWIGLMPNEHSNLIGLSKYSRLAEWVMSRPQIQEEAITQLADLLMEKVRPDGLAVVMEADHFCMHWRGVKDSENMMINSVMRGSFLKDHTLRAEFLSLIKNSEQCRRNNPRQGITGLLCVADDLFIQLLEGGRDEVCEIFNAIVRDDRHKQVRLLSYEEITERRFGNWSMGHVSIPRVNPSLLLKYFKRVELDPFDGPGQATLALLGELVATAAIATRGE